MEVWDGQGRGPVLRLRLLVGQGAGVGPEVEALPPLLEGACLGSREAPKLGLAAQEALEGRGLGPRLLVGWGLAHCLTLLQLPLHEERL